MARDNLISFWFGVLAGVGAMLILRPIPSLPPPTNGNSENGNGNDAGGNGNGGPVGPPPPPATCTGFYYTIQPGDTLFGLAQTFGLTEASILAANSQITDPELILAGQVICMPMPPPPANCTGTLYTVQAGDTLSAIAVQFGTTIEAILQANPQVPDPTLILAGQQLCIPAVAP